MLSAILSRPQWVKPLMSKNVDIHEWKNKINDLMELEWQKFKRKEWIEHERNNNNISWKTEAAAEE